MGRLQVLTWHIHGAYLYYLSHAHHDFYLPVRPNPTEGYGGRTPGYPWGDNVHEIPADQVRNLPLDVVLFQSRRNYVQDQYEILSNAQLNLPRIYLEHDPPREQPTDTRHIVDDPNVLLVHCTHFNDLMWDSGNTPTRVIEHGVVVPEGIRYTGELNRGIVVVNNLLKRGRRLGLDVFRNVQSRLPLDLIGIGAGELGGFDSLAHGELHAFESHYRFFFNPIRYTSLGLAVCEAMMLGMPIVGLATTEMATVIDNGVSGYIDTDVNELTKKMQELLRDPAQARQLGEGARRTALDRFKIERFASDWDDTFEHVTGKKRDFQVAGTFDAAVAGG